MGEQGTPVQFRDGPAAVTGRLPDFEGWFSRRLRTMRSTQPTFQAIVVHVTCPARRRRLDLPGSQKTCQRSVAHVRLRGRFHGHGSREWAAERSQKAWHHRL